MPQDIRIWEIGDGDTLSEFAVTRLDSEARLEEWLRADISMIADDLLVIGQQVATDHGGFIDLLCIDADGDLVVVELKRDMTPRDVTAQALDYASWVRDLTADRIVDIADDYLADQGPLNQAFSIRFGTELPDILNEKHRMLIVASQMDSSTERIVTYLSDAGIGINVSTFQHFGASGSREMVARVFLIEPEVAVVRSRVNSRRRQLMSFDEASRMMYERGVGELFLQLVSGLRPMFDSMGSSQSSVHFRHRFEESTNVVFSFIPSESGAERGVHFQVYSQRFSAATGLPESDLVGILPDDHQEWRFYESASSEYWGYAGHFRTEEEVGAFIRALPTPAGS